MGLTISIPEVELKINEINCSFENVNANLKTLKTRLESYLGTQLLKGLSYSNACKYFNNVYIPLVSGFISANDFLTRQNSSFISTFNRYVPNPEGFETDTDALENYITQLQNQNAQYQNEIDNMDFWDEVGEFIKEHWYWADSLREKIATNNKRIQKIRTVIDGMTDFNSSCADIYSNANNILSYIQQNIFSITWGNWNNITHQFKITLLPVDITQEVLLQSEYQKMHNDNGTINTEYIHELMNQYAICGSPEEIKAKYLALIRTFENISDKKQMEDFLNACYMIEEKEEPEKPTNPDMMDSYAYFNNQAKVQMDQYNTVSLSPVFKEMVNHYTHYIMPEDLEKIHFNSGLTEKEIRDIRNRLTHGGILQNVLAYGDVTYDYDRNYSHTVQMIKITDWQKDEFSNKNVISMTIEKSIFDTNSVSIVQYQYTDENVNVWNSIDEADTYLKSLYTSAADFAEGKIKDKIQGIIDDGIKGACEVLFIGSGPYVAGGYAAFSFLTEIAGTIDDNNASSNASNSLYLSKMTAALGIEGQLCSVNGKVGYQYMTIDQNKLALNIGAYNMAAKNYNKPQMTVADLLNNEDKLQDFTDFFCGNSEEGRYIDKYEQSLNGKDPTTIFTSEEKEMLTDSISDRW